MAWPDGTTFSTTIASQPSFNTVVLSGRTNLLVSQDGKAVVDQRLLLLVAELFMGGDERALLKAMRAHPQDQTARNAYVDFLLDHGRDLAAEMIRSGFTPGN